MARRVQNRQKNAGIDKKRLTFAIFFGIIVVESEREFVMTNAQLIAALEANIASYEKMLAAEIDVAEYVRLKRVVDRYKADVIELKKK